MKLSDAGFVRGLIVSAVLFLIFLVLNDSGIDLPTEKHRSGALESLEFMTHQRAYPNRVLPEQGYYTAFEESEMRLHKQGAISAPDKWHCIGPYNQGGRTNALAVDPNDPGIVYAGSASGGLWRMDIDENDNYSWQNLDTGYPVLGVGAIAIDPRDSDVIYIGTGEVYAYQNSDGGLYRRLTRGSYGIGLLKTADGGDTWEKSIDWTYDQQRGVQAIELDPSNPDIVYAGTSEGLYKSVDAGVTWNLVLDVIMVVDIEINPQDTDILFASCGNFGTTGTGIYRSLDGGTTWTEQTSGLPSHWTGKTLLDIYEADPDQIYADVADDLDGIALYRSTDNGDTWEPIFSAMDYDFPSYQGWFAHYVRVNPADNNKVLLAGVNYGVSTDGAQTFDVLGGMHVDHHCYANHPTDPETVYFGNDGGVYVSHDGGHNVKDLNYGYITTQFYKNVTSSNHDSLFFIGGLQDNSTVIYEGEDLWRTGLIGGDGSCTAINRTYRNFIYGSAQYLAIRVSTNGGENWSSTTSGISYDHRQRKAAFIAPYLTISATDMLAGTDRIWRSRNRGNTWSEESGILNGNSIIALAGPTTGVGKIYAATVPTSSQRAEIFKLNSSTGNWDNVTHDLPDRYITAVEIYQKNRDIAFVTLSGFGSSHLFATTDAAETWTDIGQGLPDVPTHDVLVDKDDHKNVYVANDLGVYVSTDFGQTWNDFNEGLPPAVMAMDLSMSELNRKIRIATHGNGVWQRTMLPADPDEEPGNGIDDIVPDQYELIGNYPNPFNPDTKIEIRLEKAVFVELKIYDIIGQEVKTLANRAFDEGAHYIRWDGTNSNGKSVGSGIYIAVMKAGGQYKTNKMTLIK